jgi:general secretion pathway protein D
MSRFRQLFALVCVLALAGCATTEDMPFLKAPDLMEQLANADLTAKAVTRAGGETVALQPRGRSQSQRYPGDDRIADERTSLRPGVTSSERGYEIQFADADLSEITKVILRDTLGIAYVYDPRVQGKVTLSTGGRISRDELLSILESVLAMNRGTLLRDGAMYRIVPDTGGQQDVSLSIDYVRERKETGAGYGISIVPLRYVSADNMLRILNSVATRPNAARAHVNGNLMFLRGTGQERQSMIELAGMFDIDFMRGQSAAIYVLQNTAPGEVIKELQRVFQLDGAVFCST